MKHTAFVPTERVVKMNKNKSSTGNKIHFLKVITDQLLKRHCEI